jgi:hypothetical protein
MHVKHGDDPEDGNGSLFCLYPQPQSADDMDGCSSSAQDDVARSVQADSRAAIDVKW